MKIHIFYRHEEGSRVEYSLTRQREGDPVYISFAPEGGETYPFPNEGNPVAFERVLEMAVEYAKMQDELGTVEACGITIEAQPAERRPGYEWKPQQSSAGGAISWVEVESEDKRGTAEQPIAWVAGMEVWCNYCYTDGEKRYVCIQTGRPTELCEGEYFTEF